MIGTLPGHQSQVDFPSLLSYAVHIVRKNKKLKNEKTLVSSLEDTYIRVNQILGQRNKKV